MSDRLFVRLRIGAIELPITIDLEGGYGVTPEMAQHHPKQSVRTGQSRLRMPSPQNLKLLPKSQGFQQQIPARAKKSDNRNEQKPPQG
jgi:hypothetical protein